MEDKKRFARETRWFDNEQIRAYDWGEATEDDKGQIIYPPYYTTMWDLAHEEYRILGEYLERINRELELTLDLHGNIDARGVGLR